MYTPAIRDLAGMLPTAGWQLSDVRSKCVSEVGATPSYWVSFATAYMPRVLFFAVLYFFLFIFFSFRTVFILFYAVSYCFMLFCR